MRWIPKVSRAVLNTVGEGGGLRGIWSNVRRVRALRRVIREFRPDIVLGMMTTASVLSVIAGAGLGAASSPPSTRIRRRRPCLAWQRLRRWTYPKAARVVALTSGTAAWIETHVPGSRLAVIPNPVHWPLPQAEPRSTPSPGLDAAACWRWGGCTRTRALIC